MGACVREALAHMTADICRVRHDDSPAEIREQRIGEATNRKISSSGRGHVLGWSVVRLCGTEAFVSPQGKEENCLYLSCTLSHLRSGHVVSPYIAQGSNGLQCHVARM